MTREPTEFSVVWGMRTDVGRHRELNEDAVLAFPPVFLVADGLGGHARGDAAARAVVDVFSPLTGCGSMTPGALHDALCRADQAIRGIPSASEHRPGSTLSGVCLSRQGDLPCWLVFNIGDSRTYRFSDDVLEQITVDHSRVQELIDAGGVDAAEARDMPGRNIITRALGVGPPGPPWVDRWLLPARPGDRLLMCSDGLHGEITDAEIADILRSVRHPPDVARQLVSAALAAGGHDNIAVVVVDAVTVSGPVSLQGADPATTLIGAGPA